MSLEPAELAVIEPGIRFRILPGLPGTGPLPEQFSATGRGTHPEGFVVEFAPTGRDAWIGNFQRGLTTFSEVAAHPDRRSLVVIAGGAAYVIDPGTRQLLHTFDETIEVVLVDDRRQQLVFGNGLWFEALSINGLRWRSRRISWDGMRNVIMGDFHLRGESLDLDDSWREFQVDLETGAATGESYTGP